MIGGIFCDLRKVFDSVNHEILLSKLEYYGVTGKARLLFESYLKDRFQSVMITEATVCCNNFSAWIKIRDGVWHGLVLSPLLFLIYINDFPLTINKTANPILFVDDTGIIISNTNPEEFKSNISCLD